MTLTVFLRILRGNKKGYEMRLKARQFKNKPKAKKFRVHQGVTYEVLNIAGQEIEVRWANKQDVEDFRNNRSSYDHRA